MKNVGNEAALKKNTKVRSPLIKERLGVIAYHVGQLQRKNNKKKATGSKHRIYTCISYDGIYAYFVPWTSATVGREMEVGVWPSWAAAGLPLFPTTTSRTSNDWKICARHLSHKKERRKKPSKKK